MLVNREKLEDQLRIIVSKYSADKKLKSKVGDYFVVKGLFEATALNIFAQRTPIETLPELMLCIFSMALYKNLDEDKYRINPEKFFTELEIKEATKYKFKKKQDANYPIVFEQIKQLNTNQWYTDMTAQQIKDLYDRRVVSYNPETQRQLKLKEQGGKIITQIDVNKESVQEIKKYLLDGKFFSNFITFNILENGEEEFEIVDGNLRVNGGELAIIDGFHRSLAIIDAVQENPNIDFKIGVVITHFDVETAQRFIVQEDKRNKINTKYIKSLNLENKSNTIVKKINENSKSNLKGQITTDKTYIKLGKGLIMFDVLSDSIELVFEPKENIDVINYSNYIIEGLNIIVESNTKLLEVSHDEKLWVSYIVVLGELYGKENWQDSLLRMINSIDLANIEYNSLNKGTINRIKKELMLNV
jgi:hypothetical protein